MTHESLKDLGYDIRDHELVTPDATFDLSGASDVQTIHRLGRGVVGRWIVPVVLVPTCIVAMVLTVAWPQSGLITIAILISLILITNRCRSEVWVHSMNGKQLVATFAPAGWMSSRHAHLAQELEKWIRREVDRQAIAKATAEGRSWP